MFPPNLFAMNKACQIGKKKGVTKKVHYADSTSTTRLMTPVVNAFSYARSRIIPEKPVPHAFDEIKHLMVNSTKNLVGFFKSRLKTIGQVLKTSKDAVVDPPIEETHDLVFEPRSKQNETYKTKVYKPKPETSKWTTRTDGILWQEVSHHVGRSTLYVPRGGDNMMDADCYSGVRLTEGVYDSGEKFVDHTEWFPTKPAA